jgi:hypothetical protein
MTAAGGVRAAGGTGRSGLAIIGGGKIGEALRPAAPQR